MLESASGGAPTRPPRRPVDTARIKAHWTEQARRHAGALEATTKTATIKTLELDALERALRASAQAARDDVRVLEVGCGAGHNCLELARRFPTWRFTGVDYVEGMVAAARAATQGSLAAERLAFLHGDATELDGVAALERAYDVVFTDRCLINLPSTELQLAALEGLVRRLARGGTLLLIENTLQAHARLNDAREALGLPRRPAAEYNAFLDEEHFVPRLRSLVELVAIEDFGSLHDLVLYALLPATSRGEVGYGHPLVQAATTLSLAASTMRPSPFGSFGQNRLFIGRIPAR